MVTMELRLISDSPLICKKITVMGVYVTEMDRNSLTLKTPYVLLFHYKNVISHSFSKYHHSCLPPFVKCRQKFCRHFSGVHRGQFSYLTTKDDKTTKNLVQNSTVTGPDPAITQWPMFTKNVYYHPTCS